MIENFELQPYPLECAGTDGAVRLVIGWAKLGDGRLAPWVTPAEGEPGGLVLVNNPETLQYRPMGSRIVPGALDRTTPVAPAVEPSRRARQSTPIAPT